MYYVYVIECLTPGYVYVGSTHNWQQRIWNHLRGSGTTFTQTFGVKAWHLVATVDTRIAALELETAWTNILSDHFIVEGRRPGAIRAEEWIFPFPVHTTEQTDMTEKRISLVKGLQVPFAI